MKKFYKTKLFIILISIATILVIALISYFSINYLVQKFNDHQISSQEKEAINKVTEAKAAIMNNDIDKAKQLLDDAKTIIHKIEPVNESPIPSKYDYYHVHTMIEELEKAEEFKKQNPIDIDDPINYVKAGKIEQ